MRKVCFLSMDDLGDFVIDDELAIKPLNEIGWEVETVSWKSKGVDWKKYEAVIIRTPWDYHKEPNEFLEVLRKIEDATQLHNPYDVVKWNLSKTYLCDLEANGVKTVPTVVAFELISEELVSSWFENFDSKEIIIKPVVSATAKDTYRVTEFSKKLADVFRDRKYMVQPFMQNIVDEGEYSLFYFGGIFSHSILKTPKRSDFRVQEDFGGVNKLIEPTEKLLETADRVLEQIDENLLYARVDMVRDEADEFALMELELIEPALYFRMDKDSPRRFAETFNEMIDEL